MQRGRYLHPKQRYHRGGKVAGFLWYFSILHFAQREHRGIFYLFKAVRVDMWQRQLEDGSLRLIPCGKNHSILLAHIWWLLLFYLFFCPKEVVLDRGREEWYTRNDLKGCPSCRPLTPWCRSVGCYDWPYTSGASLSSLTNTKTD